MIMNPTAIKHVVVDGHSLTLESFVAIARYNATVELAPSAVPCARREDRRRGPRGLRHHHRLR